MGFHGAEGNENLPRYFFIAVAFCHQLQDLQFPPAQFQLRNGCRVGAKVRRRGDKYLFFHHHGFHLWPGEFQRQPYTQGCKNDGDGAGVDLEGVVDNQEPELQPFQQEEQQTQADAVKDGLFVPGKKAATGRHGINIENLVDSKRLAAI